MLFHKTSKTPSHFCFVNCQLLLFMLYLLQKGLSPPWRNYVLHITYFTMSGDCVYVLRIDSHQQTAPIQISNAFTASCRVYPDKQFRLYIRNCRIDQRNCSHGGSHELSGKTVHPLSDVCFCHGILRFFGSQMGKADSIFHRFFYLRFGYDMRI